MLPNSLLRPSHEVQAEQLNELVLDILYEVETGLPISLHDENREEALWLLHTAVKHSYEH
jgi:hypothetical protein